jgi:hypothetical protein
MPASAGRHGPDSTTCKMIDNLDTTKWHDATFIK